MYFIALIHGFCLSRFSVRLPQLFYLATPELYYHHSPFTVSDFVGNLHVRIDNDFVYNHDQTTRNVSQY
jgi:hypothetical protein